MHVSVIIPTHNRPGLSVRAVQSVLQQTYPYWELIIVDDGSNDNTAERVASFIRDHSNFQIKLVKTKNLGVSHARNIGARLAKYNWISFLDSDDEWLPNKLQDQVNFILENNDFKWVYTNENWIKNNVFVNKPKSCTKFSGATFKQATERCFIGASTVLIDKSMFNQFRGFNESLPVCEDYDLWLKLLSKNPVGYINKPLINKYAGHKEQLSLSSKSMNYWRILSLSQILTHIELTVEQKVIAQNFIKLKAPSLIKGLKKHQKNNKAQIINDILLRTGNN